MFFTALARFREQQGLGTRTHKFRFKNKLLSLDSTTISLCLTLFRWAKFRRAKGGVKAHVLLDRGDYLPAYVLLTEAKRSDVKLADSLMLNPGSIVAIDRGYIDYALFGRWSPAWIRNHDRDGSSGISKLLILKAQRSQQNARNTGTCT